MEPLVEWRFPQPIFDVALHPIRPILLCGLADGQVLCYEYDGNVTKLIWSTKRHRGSVRSLCVDAEFVYSVGADSVLKKARVETGRVVQKTRLPPGGFTRLARCHEYLLVGDESGGITVLDSETLSSTKRIPQVHGDAVNGIFQFAGRSLHRYVSVGETTVAQWDARAGNDKVVVSEDQGDEVLCGTFTDSETVVCGMGEGVLTVWKPGKNRLEDQVNRIKVCANESVDCVVADQEDAVWCGCSDGKIYRADVRRGRVVESRVHGDEVTFVGIDCDNRVVSGSMDKIVVWGEAPEAEAAEGDEPEDAELAESAEPDEDDKSEDGVAVESDEPDSDEPGESDESDDEDGTVLTGLSREELIAELDKDLTEDDDEKPEPRKKNKKRKLAGKHASSHGIAKFEGL
ncbi:hypothetical protein HG537_0A08710 [Torulaspora globosa]|uniref:WD repeat-containing protein JIP5 n=1 Tax=Torulaspora globosa TaxID=48254 RepID=A0A7H9HLD0_9SACH|nr:hypothetical protein HG537_0A08710 [Torulaspora sp. CBS 2947]